MISLSKYFLDYVSQLILMVWLIAGFLDSELIFNFVAHLWYHYLKVCTQPTALVMDFQCIWIFTILRFHEIHHKN